MAVIKLRTTSRHNAYSTAANSKIVTIQEYKSLVIVPQASHFKVLGILVALVVAMKILLSLLANTHWLIAYQILIKENKSQ